jgi:protoporphyrinogen oxidase
MKRKIAIIGAGIGGLYAAYKLKDKFEVLIFEKEKEIGGLLCNFKLNGKNLEKTYHHIFSSDKDIINLINELGLTNKLIWKKENNAIIYDKKIYSFCGPIDLLKFPLLTILEKLRLGIITLYLQKENNYKKFQKYQAYEWMRRYCGEKVYKIIWEPLLKNKFADKYKDISMVWLWARIHSRGNAKLGYLKGGFHQIVDKLAQGLEIVKKEVKAEELKGYDLIIDTSPLKSVKYLGAVDIVFTSKQYLSKFYWHNINQANAPFVAFINHSNMVDDYGDYVYYLGGYYPQNHRYFKDKGKDEVVYKEFFDYLKQIFPDFKEKEIKKKFIFKFPYAQHLPSPNTIRKTLFDKENNKQKIIHMNFAQIYPQDRGVNYAVKQAKKVVSSFQ